MKVLAFDPKKNHQILVGELYDGILTLNRNPKIHKLRIFPAYGIQESVFSEYNFNKVVIKEKYTGKRYESDTEDWLLESVVKDLGHDKQLFLGLQYMKTV